ncbi:hypothetical protein KO507_09275 [Gilvimarinus agarilyticus]|uniref:HvfA family oxazolone/thioamide-modified RiPP metallophore n=1 Tax=unclassified Gilvimarinus TaxID=2642066 RepID=UPI001C09A7BB|nr:MULTISPECIES: hypothetical protein [unclassified Gilvimarinus]MBU2885950.1 hypothetical protein [Gilvimarinus agarilyticus]MDO6570696.1 hypothetical protein [Gilvimarinus sp. 2_MG-2023]MDO6747711.1 hypothetical protein [Gilvimarinus sp. 1_MG-2023]
MNKNFKAPMAAAVGAAFMASAAMTSVATAAENPFAAETLQSGYKLADAEGKCGEGKCGEEKADREGKCGEEKAESEGKCGEGKCGEAKADTEGKCGGEKADKEGTCGH